MDETKIIGDSVRRWRRRRNGRGGIEFRKRGRESSRKIRIFHRADRKAGGRKM